MAAAIASSPLGGVGGAEEGAAKIEREIRVLDEMIDRSAADRAYLDANGTLPPPGVPPPPVVRHSTVTDATSSQG